MQGVVMTEAAREKGESGKREEASRGAETQLQAERISEE